MPSIEVTIDQSEIPDEVFFPVLDEVFNMIVDATPVATGYAAGQWRLQGDTISNDCEYISYLEDGWSDQAPDGMVGPALDEMPSLLREAMSNYDSGN